VALEISLQKLLFQLSLEKQNGHETEDDLRAQVAGLKQGLKQYEDMIGQYQVSEQTRKREVDSALITAREVVERERREKLDVLSDRKSREEQFEQLSKTTSLIQVRLWYIVFKVQFFSRICDGKFSNLKSLWRSSRHYFVQLYFVPGV
jgi:N-methylhydantoinase B/oxoprolinase/acetone carboxylase alpha subunit